MSTRCKSNRALVANRKIIINRINPTSQSRDCLCNEIKWINNAIIKSVKIMNPKSYLNHCQWFHWTIIYIGLTRVNTRSVILNEWSRINVNVNKWTTNTNLFQVRCYRIEWWRSFDQVFRVLEMRIVNFHQSFKRRFCGLGHRVVWVISLKMLVIFESYIGLNEGDFYHLISSV